MRPSIADEIRRELDPVEDMLWSGRPGWRYFDSETVDDTLIWLIFTGFLGVCFVFLGAGEDFSALLLFACGVFALVCLLIFGPYDHAKLVYGLTDRRVYIVHRWLRRRIEVYPLRGMAVTNVVLADERNDGIGTVRFADFAQVCGYHSDEICMPGFTKIPDAARVADLIRTAIEAVPESTKPKYLYP